MTEKEIMNWMRNKARKGDFGTAAGLAQEFLAEHKITDTLDPDFSRTIDAGFKLADELAEM